ncbi:MAG: competence/damage-inducible protein A, partial [Acidobacteriota bacterium]|nr:competence/damage-inducible protein A [Acidobacteriota bacterium]
MGLIRAELIAVGSELVHFSRRDTNSDWLTARLLGLGIRVGSRLAIEDDEERIAREVSAAIERSPVVLVSGGLGPTEDDRTRPGVARALGRPLVCDEKVVRALQRGFAARGYTFLPEQTRQAERPEGAVWLPNPLGTAPGFFVELERGLLFALPGVPAELRRMFDEEVASRVKSRFGVRGIAHRVFRVSRKTESSLDAAIRDLYDEPGLTVTVLARSTGLEVLATVETDDRAESTRRLDALDRRRV